MTWVYAMESFLDFNAGDLVPEKPWGDGDACRFKGPVRGVPGTTYVHTGPTGHRYVSISVEVDTLH